MLEIQEEKLHSEKLHKKIFNTNKKEFIGGLFSVGIIVLIMFFVVKKIGLENIQDVIKQTGIWGPIILILAKASTIIFAPLGGGFLYIIAAPLFGFWPGFFYVFLGDMLGDFSAFGISKIFGRKITKFFLSDYGMQYIDEILNHITTVKGFICTRIIFMGMHDVISYVAGLTKISFLQFSLTSIAVAFFPTMLVVATGAAVVHSVTMTIVAVMALGFSSLVLAFLGIKFLKKKCIF
ncbi:MAG: VTT domain-containing protein [Patescibacteria group bacterium]